jgi:hypothetical protein
MKPVPMCQRVGYFMISEIEREPEAQELVVGDARHANQGQPGLIGIEGE